MTKQVQIWSPDTHPVQFLVEWDSDDLEAEHVCLGLIGQDGVRYYRDEAGFNEWVDLRYDRRKAVYETLDEPFRSQQLAALEADRAGLLEHGKVYDADLVTSTYTAVMAEHRLKNLVLGVIQSALPDTMTKPVLDSDGDPTGERVVKDKHRPVLNGATDAVLSFSIPGAAQAVVEDARAALAASPDVPAGSVILTAD